MSGRPGIVFVGEDPDDADSLIWSGRFSAHWEAPDGEMFVQGPEGVSPDEAIRWGREQADVVLIRPGDSEVHYSAGTQPPSPDPEEGTLPEWPAGREVPRRRQPGFEHLDLIAEDEIEWEVRMEPGPEVGARPDQAETVRRALASTDGVSGVEVEAGEEGGLAVRFIVAARSHSDALRETFRAQEAIRVALPAMPAGAAYVWTGLDPSDGVRPLRPSRRP